jgi:glycosyltransferase involved in cell wall biosynthesis
VVARFVGGLRSADSEFAAELGLGDRVEEIPHVPRRSALELQRDSEALLLLLPEAGGRGRTVPSGKIFEYLAAERPILAAVPPDGVAAELVRQADAGVVVAPDDVAALTAAIEGLRARWKKGALANGSLSEELKERLSRRTRSREFADLLREVG